MQRKEQEQWEELIARLDKEDIEYSLDETGGMIFASYEDYLRAKEIGKEVGVITDVQ